MSKNQKVSTADSEKKQQQNIDYSAMWKVTRGKRLLILASVILSTLAAIVSFVPYISIYKVVELLILNYPNLSAQVTSEMVMYGWFAFAGVAGNVVLYLLALVASHLAAFGTLYKLKLEFATHLSRVPLGFHVITGSGKLRKVMDENIEKIEGFIAHQIPDLAASIVAPIVAIVILFAFDWRFGAVSMVAILVSFALQFSLFFKSGAREMMEKYETQMEDMNNGAVEFIRGISVIKAFNQTADSFKSIKNLIHESTEETMKYTMSWRSPMSAFMALIMNL